MAFFSEAWVIQSRRNGSLQLPTSSSSSFNHHILFATTPRFTTNTITSSSNRRNPSHTTIDIHQHVGSGSYGTVYLCQYTDLQGNTQTGIAKRAWTLEELENLQCHTNKIDTTPNSSSSNNNNNNDEVRSTREQQHVLLEKVKRAEYYLSVEQHCLTQIQVRSTEHDTMIAPAFLGRFKDSKDGQEWIVMKVITDRSPSVSVTDTEQYTPTPPLAKTLKQVMDKDWIEQHDSNHTSSSSYHHLRQIQNEFRLSSQATFVDILDTVLLELLSCVQKLHSMNIVHRDIKPDNILIDGDNKVHLFSIRGLIYIFFFSCFDS